MNDRVNLWKEINLFNDHNKALLKYFFIFFLIAIFGYLSIIISFCPYNDDLCRYLINAPVGTFSAGRHTTFLIEIMIYFSRYITDAAPFTQILSCATLSYTAIIIIKIFNIDVEDKVSLLCMVPFLVNPYLMENIMYRFDNIFMMLAMMSSVVSAYVTLRYGCRFLLVQSILLLQSLLMYQAAFSAYFILFMCIFIKEFIDGNGIISIFSKMKCWIFTVLTTCMLFVPFTLAINYCRSASGEIVALPLNTKNITIIYNNISNYLSNIYFDWSGNFVGNIFFLLIVFFFFSSQMEIYKKSKNVQNIIYNSFIFAVLFFVFLISPFGICAFVQIIAFHGNLFFSPRVMYCMGIFISFILYRNYLFLKKSNLFKSIYSTFLVLFCMWNLIFMNSAGNIIHYNRIVQRDVLYDLSKDIMSEINSNPSIKYVCIDGDIYSRPASRFAKIYPIFDRIMPEKWHTPAYAMLSICCDDIADIIFKYMPIKEPFNQNNYSSKKFIKSHIWYKMYLFDGEVLYIDFKTKSKYSFSSPTMLRVRD